MDRHSHCAMSSPSSSRYLCLPFNTIINPIASIPLSSSVEWRNYTDVIRLCCFGLWVYLNIGEGDPPPLLASQHSSVSLITYSLGRPLLRRCGF